MIYILIRWILFIRKVQEYILKMKENGYLYEKETDEDYCES